VRVLGAVLLVVIPQLPPDVSTAHAFTLGGVLRTVKNLQEYITQVQTYCFNNGIEYAAISNGWQWVIFRAVRTDGIHVGRGRVVVFKSLEDIRDRFVAFWSLLSRASVENNSLARTFQPSEATAFQYKRVADEVHYYNEKVTRNDLSADLEPLIREYMGEIADDKSKEKLRDLFVKGPALAEVLNAVGHQMTVALSNTLATANRVFQSRKVDDLKGSIKQKIKSHIALPSRGEVILLLGRVGSGKTTFVHHFLRIDLKDLLEKHFLVSFDFRLLAKERTVDSFFYERLRVELSRNELFTSLSSKNLRKVYAAEINELTKGPLAGLERANRKHFEEKIADFLLSRYEKPEDYLTRTLRYLADMSGVRCVLVLDNVDQLEATRQQEILRSRIRWLVKLTPSACKKKTSISLVA
jgi:hypothetical protein